MGYYSDFEISIKENKGSMSIQEINKNIKEFIENEVGYYASGLNVFDAKWYSWEEDLKRLTEELNDVVIEVERTGEESGDLQRNYFKNGKMQECIPEIVYENFDESKMR